jgi:quinol monooxygenase YgiN
MKVNSQKIIRTIIVTVVSSVSLVVFAYEQNTPKVSYINPDAGVLTMVNVVTPDTGKQSETIQLLQAGMEKTMRHQPGFISANIHRSLNSEHVVVYAQWKDQASVDAASKLIQRGKAPNMSKVFSQAQPAYHPYEVVSVHPASISK